jgi:hypothetical protein
MAHSGHLAGAPAARGGATRRRPFPRRRARIFVRRHPWFTGFAAVVVALLIIAHIVGFAIAEPLRKVAERRMNEALVGYSVKIGGLRLNIFGLGFDLLDVSVVQNAHPKPAVATIPRFAASIQWKALLSAKVVGDLILDSPRVYLNLTQVKTEAADPHKLKDHGWQEALERIYPLKINALLVKNGQITYDDGSALAPIHATEVRLLTENIRNVASREGTFPSPLRIDGRVFDSGRAHFDGAADYLAEPSAALRGDFSISALPLKPLTPIARQYAVQLTGGQLDLDGKLESVGQKSEVDLRKVSIEGVKADFVQEGTTGQRGDRVAKQAVHSATEPKKQPQTVVKIDELHIGKSELGYVEKETDPSYRLFISNLDATVTGFSNQTKGGPGKARIRGAVMGSGSALLDATFQPSNTRADFSTNLQIENVDMVKMNDFLRARGGFDVVAGSFSMYSEIAVKNGHVDGWVKPMFKDLDVYDRRQDAGKSIFRQAYEGIVGGVGTLLENRPRDEVATVTDLSGQIDNPQTSTLQIVLGLLQNAFVRAILPGLGQQAGHR